MHAWFTRIVIAQGMWRMDDEYSNLATPAVHDKNVVSTWQIYCEVILHCVKFDIARARASLYSNWQCGLA